MGYQTEQTRESECLIECMTSVVVQLQLDGGAGGRPTRQAAFHMLWPMLTEDLLGQEYTVLP